MINVGEALKLGRELLAAMRELTAELQQARGALVGGGFPPEQQRGAGPVSAPGSIPSLPPMCSKGCGKPAKYQGVSGAVVCDPSCVYQLTPVSANGQR